VAVLHHKPNQSSFPEQRPDYFVEETDAWIVYPWDVGVDELPEGHRAAEAAS
jgi:hypothetical protein